MKRTINPSIYIKKMKTDYISRIANVHIREEENQWSAILSVGNPYASILIVHDQKLCAIAHEIGVAISAGVISDSQIEFYANRLKSRIDRVLDLLKGGDSLDFRVVKNFKNIKEKLTKFRNDNKTSYEVFKHLPEEVHMASHELCDELYEMTVRK